MTWVRFICAAASSLSHGPSDSNHVSSRGLSRIGPGRGRQRQAAVPGSKARGQPLARLGIARPAMDGETLSQLLRAYPGIASLAGVLEEPVGAGEVAGEQ